MLADLVHLARDRGASDLLLESFTPPVIRLRGELVRVGEPLAGEQVMRMARHIVGDGDWEGFRARGSHDVSWVEAGVRLRANVFRTARGVAVACRLLTAFQATLRDCNLHPELRRFVEARTGLVLISGPTGSGKSTTLAALVEELNQSAARHVITLESPIEYVFANRRSLIRQREIPTHSPSYEQAITDAMRENPDVLVIGELRTPEVMRLTLTAAETGHLVLATLHSSSCAEALMRVCMSFAPEIQPSIRAQLADCLNGVLCQRMTYLPQEQLRVPQLEIMVANHAIKNNLRSGQLAAMASTLQTGADEGMMSFDRYQRWMDQRSSWVRPSQATPLSAEPLPPAPELARRVAAPAESALPRRPKPPTAPALAGDPSPGRIEIPSEEVDLEELARKIAGS